MADIAHTVPGDISFLDESTIGMTRPGLQVTQFATGPFSSRDWFGHNVREYDMRVASLDSTAQQNWRRFLHQVNGGGDVVWIVEPVSETHYDLICGPIADGTRTTFWIPAYNPSSVTVFVDGAPQSSGYNVRTAANLILDVAAECDDEANFVAQHCTDVGVGGVALDGEGSMSVTPSGAGNPIARPLTSADAAAAAEYTSMVAILETKASPRDFRAEIDWRDSGLSQISLSTASYSAAVTGEWTIFTLTATAPGSTVYAVPRLRCNSTATDVFYYDCFAICPGDYDRWHLPSQSPGLIEFSSAPASGSRITATATGQRIARCRMDSNKLAWRVMSSGTAYPANISAIEAPEF